MDNNTKLNSSLRVLDIYLRFNQGEKLTTKQLSVYYDTTTRTIVRDIEKINSFISSKILFDKSTNLWAIEEKEALFLDKYEQFILNILDKACVEQGEEFHKKSLKLFDKFKTSLHNTIYNNIDSEDITNIKEQLAKVENAIHNRNKIQLTYKDKIRTIEPLKLANFEGYWYLVLNDLTNNRIKTFYFKEISNIIILNETYTITDTTIERKLNNAINAYFTTDVQPYEIKLFISKEKADIFKRKPLSKSQNILKQYSDGSFDFSVVITHDMELIPKIQQFMPHLKVIVEDENSQRIVDRILKNIRSFANEY